ncbi:hypothetical protein APA386B_236 [Acetobacter pasteurianus 386B]|nr:hypothetical protein APA386B_236 [Acetobacter pasteurianus 386B]
MQLWERGQIASSAPVTLALVADRGVLTALKSVMM